MRIVDADALKQIAEDHGFNFVDFQAIDNAPTVDAVLVVRCKDCKYFTQKVSVGGFCKCGEVNGGTPFMRVNEDFCSYGERKDGER